MDARQIAPGRSVFHAGALYVAGQEAELYSAMAGEKPGEHLTSGDAPVLVGPWAPGDADADGKSDTRQAAGRASSAKR